MSLNGYSLSEHQPTKIKFGTGSVRGLSPLSYGRIHDLKLSSAAEVSSTILEPTVRMLEVSLVITTII